MRVFVAGPRAIGAINNDVLDVLSRMIDKKLTVLVGDANGVDKLVQGFFANMNYPNVHIYASDGKVRNNLGEWPIHKVNVSKNLKGFDYYAQKDICMAQDADSGFMIWNGKSKGTLNNIINMTNQHKNVVVYITHLQRVTCINEPEGVKRLVEYLGTDALSVYEKLHVSNNQPNRVDKKVEQLIMSEFR